MSDVVRLKITLIGTEPLIWRRVEILATTTLKALHTVIQAVMGWRDDHPFQFEVRGYRASGGRASLSDLVTYGVRRFKYIYGMADFWEHDLYIEQIYPAAPHTVYPRFIDGADRGPPKDGAETHGIHGVLESRTGSTHLGHRASSARPIHADDLDQDAVNAKLARIAKRSSKK